MYAFVYKRDPVLLKMFIEHLPAIIYLIKKPKFREEKLIVLKTSLESNTKPSGGILLRKCPCC